MVDVVETTPRLLSPEDVQRELTQRLTASALDLPASVRTDAEILDGITRRYDRFQNLQLHVPEVRAQLGFDLGWLLGYLTRLRTSPSR